MRRIVGLCMCLLIALQINVAPVAAAEPTAAVVSSVTYGNDVERRGNSELKRRGGDDFERRGNGDEAKRRGDDFERRGKGDDFE